MQRRGGGGRGALVALVLVAAGCGGVDREAAPAPASPPPALDRSASPSRTVATLGPVAGRCRPGELRPLGNGTLAFAAVVRRRARAFRMPGGRQLAAFGRLNRNGVPTVFGVLAARVDTGCSPQWLRVQLPLRPNGAVGWVRVEDVRLRKVATRIEIDLSERRVTLLSRGRRVLTTTAAIGSPSTPTPTGRYYVNQRLLASDPTGSFGPGGVGISAFSPVLKSWPQGGPIAIHGTNAPDGIGFAVSHGCLRVRNEDAARLLRLAVEGTPVEIRM